MIEQIIKKKMRYSTRKKREYRDHISLECRANFFRKAIAELRHLILFLVNNEQMPMRILDFFGKIEKILYLNIEQEYIMKLLRYYMAVRMYGERNYYVFSGPNMTDIAGYR